MFKKGLSSGYNFNAFKEIKSHSSVLFNERLAILFYILDIDSIDLNRVHSKDMMLKVKATTYQIWKNIRTLVRNNPGCRKTLNLETKDEGVYTIDVAFDIVSKMIIWMENNSDFTYRNIFIVVEHLNKIEIIMRDILQYFQYFIRADFKQLPDILLAAEEYKKYADKLTLEQLREIIGKNNKVDFESLGLATDDASEEFETTTEDDIEISEMEDEYDLEDEEEK